MVAGTRAWFKVRERLAMHLKNIDMARIHMKLNKKKMKKAPGSRRKFVRKYKTRLKHVQLISLFGKSQSIEDRASEKGW